MKIVEILVRDKGGNYAATYEHSTDQQALHEAKSDNPEAAVQRRRLRSVGNREAHTHSWSCVACGVGE